MKRFVLDFLHRGAVACGIGPVVLAIIYLILQGTSGVEELSVNGVCIGIFSITALAFVAGGMNAVYQIERLPLMAAILIHGAVLYFSYLCTYLLNDWLDKGALPLIVFTAVFAVGFIVIWLIIYFIIRKSTAKLNKMLSENHKRQSER
ncbi:MAG: DUF3021 domain-containing protein [Clostridia bacterium]|nr:DUF3021 domain-containing protein [Clostridia bacterium]